MRFYHSQKPDFTSYTTHSTRYGRQRQLM
jgi:hypothetical protein